MPSEQLRGKIIDARADQFAFCVALYEALYRQMPFNGTNFAETSQAVLADELRAPPIKTEVPAYVWPILRRGLARDRDARWPDTTVLLDQLVRDPWRRWRPWVASLAAGTVLVLGTGWEVQRAVREGRRCTVSTAAEVGFWSPAARAAMGRAFAATGKPFALDYLARATQTLDQEVQAWAIDETAWCEAVKTRPQDPELLRVSRTLKERRDALVAAVDVLGSATEEDVEHAPMALESVRGRARASAVRAMEPSPSDPEASDELERAHFLGDDGKLEDAKRLAIAGTERAHAVGDRRSEARGLYLQGRETFHGSDSEGQTEELYRRAILLGGASGADEVVARARIGLVDVISIDPKRAHEVQGAIADAQSAIERVGSPPALASSLLDCEAQFYSMTGDVDRARDLLKQATELARQVSGPHGLSVATELNNLGTMEGRVGHWQAAIASYREAVAIDEETMGHQGPDLARALLGLASMLSETGSDPEALDLSNRGAAIFLELGGPQSTDYATALGGVADSELELRRIDQARQHAVQSLAIFQPHQDTVDPAFVVGSLYIQGTCDLRQGHLKEAQASAERAYALAQQVEGEPMILAQTQYLLSQVLASNPTQRARALELGLAALKLMPPSERHQPDIVAWVAKIRGTR